MVAFKNTIVGLVVAALATSAAADTCQAVGTINRGAVLSSGFSVFKGDDQLCKFDGELSFGTVPNKGDENVIKECGNLEYPVAFFAEAPSYKFKSCQVDFGEDKGNEGKVENHSHASGCTAEFEC